MVPGSAPLLYLSDCQCQIEICLGTINYELIKYLNHEFVAINSDEIYVFFLLPEGASG